MFRAISSASRLLQPLNQVQRTRTYLTSPALGTLVDGLKYATLIQTATFQPDGECIPHGATLFKSWREKLDPNASTQTFSFGEEQDIMQKQGLPSALLNTKPIDATSADNIYQAIEEHGCGVLMHYGIGTGYPELHALIVCDVFEMHGKRYAILLDTNNRGDNPAIERARQLLTPGASLTSLSNEELASAGVQESFFRVVNLDGLIAAGQEAFALTLSKTKTATTWTGWLKNLVSPPPMQPTLFVPDEALLADKTVFRTPEGTLTTFASAVLTNRIPIEYD